VKHPTPYSDDYNASKMCSVKTILRSSFLLANPFTDIDDCVNHTCGNGGSCEDGVNSYSCNCLVGFTGDQCETGRCACAHNFGNLRIWLAGLI